MLNQACTFLASKHGHLEVLKYLIDNGCQISDKCINIALEYGHISILNFLKDIVKTNIDCISITSAIKSNNISIVKWILDNPNLKINKFIGVDLTYAIKNKNYKLIEYIKQKNLPIENKYFDVYSTAGEMKDFEMIHFLLKNKFPKSNEAYIGPALKGYLDIIIFLYNCQFPINEKMMNSAAEGGHKHILDWGFENNLPYENDLLIKAGKSGNLNLCKELYDKGFLLNNHIYNYCYEYDDIIIWVYECGIIPKNLSLFIDNINILEYLIAKGCKPDQDFILKCIITKRNDILLYAIEHNFPININLSYEKAIEVNNNKAILILENKGYIPSDSKLYKKNTSGSIFVFKFLKKYNLPYPDDYEITSNDIRYFYNDYIKLCSMAYNKISFLLVIIHFNIKS